MPPTAPRMAPGAGDCPADTPTQAPESAPQKNRAISPTGAVRLGVEGSLSAISSAIASTLKIATAAVEPMNASREPARFSQLLRAAQATTAGPVNDRIPETIPIANASTRTKVALMERDVALPEAGVKKLLTFAFYSPIVRGGRGNGKRVAFSSIASLALTNWAPPVENSEP